VSSDTEIEKMTLAMFRNSVYLFSLYNDSRYENRRNQRRDIYQDEDDENKIEALIIIW